MARSFAVVGLLLGACGAAPEAAPDPASRQPPPAPSESVGSSDPPPGPSPPAECRPSPGVDGAVALAPIPKGVTADFAVYGRGPAIVVTPEGSATLVWRSGGAVFARMYRDARWLDVETVASPDPGIREHGPSPKLAALPEGGVVVAFHEAPTSMIEQVVCVRQRTGAGSWSKVSTIARTGAGWWQDPQPAVYGLVADPSGNVTALVRALPVDQFTAEIPPVGLLALRAPAGGAFGAPILLSATPSSAFSLTAHPTGEALALWADAPGPTKVAAFAHDHGWRHSPPSLFYGALSATPEVDGSTSVIGAWSADGIYRVQTAKRAPDGSWGAAIDVGMTVAMHSANIVSDETGRALATWSGAGSARCSVTSGVARRDASGNWALAELIPEAPPARTAISSTALSRTGHTVIAWNAEQSGSGQGCFGDSALYLSWISPSGTWSRPMLLDAGRSLSDLSVALTPTGRALASWRHEDRVLVRWVDAP